MTRESIPSLLTEHHVDALIAASPESVAYLSETYLITQRTIPSRLAFVVITPDGDPTLVVCSIEEQQVRSESPIHDVRPYAEFAEGPIRALAATLRQKGLGSGRLGLEARFLPLYYVRQLERELPNAELVDGDDILDRARMVKSPAEVEHLAAAARATDMAIRTTFQSARIGDSEQALAERLETGLTDAGADGLAFLVLTTGANSRLSHPVPSTLPVAAGDVVRTDSGGYFGAYYAGYMSDLARTAVAGRASERQRDAYARLFDVHRLLLDAVRPGVRASDLYQRCKTAFAERKLEFRLSHIGHSIGHSVHEYPMLNDFTDQPLVPGMVLAIEPIHFAEDGIFHIEDMLEVTESGARLLSSPSEWSELHEIR
jgi:Xaa-Pro dipeptidase